MIATQSNRVALLLLEQKDGWYRLFFIDVGRIFYQYARKSERAIAHSSSVLLIIWCWQQQCILNLLPHFAAHVTVAIEAID